MDWKQFISEMTSHLAWPIAVFFLFIVFKVELRKIIERLTQIKYKDLQMEFNKVQEQAEALPPESTTTSPGESSPTLVSLEDQMLDAVDRAPSAAILLAWSGVESAIAGAVSRLAISPESPSYRSPLHNIEALDKDNRLSRTHKILLHEMRDLRNSIAHNQPVLNAVTHKQAREYVNTAIKLIKHFESYRPLP